MEVSCYEDAIKEWNFSHTQFPVERHLQKGWDTINIRATKSSFNCVDKADAARFLASQNTESSHWLNVLPSKIIGTLLSDSTFRISVALRYGCDVCIPHDCSCGEAFVNSDGIHGLSCRHSAGRFGRHSEFNKILKLGLASAQVPSRLEPCGLNSGNRERPDGITLIPWSNGRFLTWDATCLDTLAPSYIDVSSRSVGKTAERGAAIKVHKYKDVTLAENHIFVPVAIESMGPICVEGKKFISEVGRRIADVTGEFRSTQFLHQRLSIALQNFNAGCILGTFPQTSRLDEVFLL